jgi:hypothetical protein
MFVWERDNNVESEKQLWILIFNKLNVEGRNKKKILNRKKNKNLTCQTRELGQSGLSCQTRKPVNRPYKV